VSYYWHHVPGRLRIKTPFVKGKEDGAFRIQRILKHIPGIRSISSNPITGSVVIRYDEQTACPKNIADHLAFAGYFDRSKAITNDQYIHAAASSALSLLSRFI
jgi:hypothetical protein